jgi:hypothetical protein
MKITSSIEIKKFRNGYLLKEYFLDEDVTIRFVEFLGKMGVAEYFPDFARPFFRITRDGKFMIKGINGNSSFQVFFFNTPELNEPDITQHISLYDST